MQMIMGVMSELFTTSLPSKTKDESKHLGDLATHLVMLLTSIEPYNELLMENPLLHAYGSIEQQYLDLTREATLAESYTEAKWPLKLRSIALPQTDEVFVDRFQQSVAIGVSKVARSLVEYMRELDSCGSPTQIRYSLES
jgi:hypothetical protein